MAKNKVLIKSLSSSERSQSYILHPILLRNLTLLLKVIYGFSIKNFFPERRDVPNYKIETIL